LELGSRGQRAKTEAELRLEIEKLRVFLKLTSKWYRWKCWKDMNRRVELRKKEKVEMKALMETQLAL